jgi:hypothetical protein
MKENFLYSYKTIFYCNLAHFTLFLHSVTAKLIAAAAAKKEILGGKQLLVWECTK